MGTLAPNHGIIFGQLLYILLFFLIKPTTYLVDIICNYSGCDLTRIRGGHLFRKPFVNEALPNFSCSTITNEIAV